MKGKAIAEKELTNTRIVSHLYAHPFCMIPGAGEKSTKTPLMTEKIGVNMGTFLSWAVWTNSGVWQSGFCGCPSVVVKIYCKYEGYDAVGYQYISSHEEEQ